MPSIAHVLLVLCLSMHAWHTGARPLGLNGKKTHWNCIHLQAKDMGHDSQEAKLHHDTSIPCSRLRPFVLKEEEPKESLESSAKMILQGSKIAVSGDEIALSLHKERLKEAIKIKGVKREGRSMLGDAHHDAKESVDDNDNDNNNNNMEDISEMDYAQPHRKPPIHNEKRP